MTVNMEIGIVNESKTQSTPNDISETPTVEAQVRKEIGSSWFEAEEEHRVRTGRLSLTRIIFVCLIEESDSFDVKQSNDVIGATKLYDFFANVNGDEAEDDDEPTRCPAGGIMLLSNNRESTVPSSALGFLEIGMQE
eukprot:CAMPEP_0197248950 /NCGR_PEP_ID=MMETSP1429-20130617/44060_1 /TAXON_ID=49237 /ORGANISM="Chaetoceros  sp., Strain UNC1202" /LENGTH=136 /DNA_ID=CAMNT_0042710331 /DNA_START=92 /DNA_END=499 /DNA_ORIENTATION=+